jgi:DNA-binding CsgD family transcriptional regulator
VLAANEVEALLGLGEWDTAAEVLAAALGRGGEYWSYHLHMLRSQLATGRGDLEVARTHLALADTARTQPTAAPYYAAVAAELALATGRPDKAADAVAQGLHEVATVGLPTLAVRLCAIGLRVPTMDSLTLIRQARVAHATAGTLEAAGWLELAKAEHAGGRPGRWRSAVERWNALGRPYLAAYCDWRLAEALVATAGGSSLDAGSGLGFGEATEALRRAHDIATRLGAAPLREEVELLALRARLHLRPPPAPATADEAGALGLTAREAEVLRLLALGYTNRDIASELTISVKTASVHVSNILRKLDVPGRVQAAAFARKLPAR